MEPGICPDDNPVINSEWGKKEPLRGSGSLPWNLYLVGEIYRKYLPADLASRICTDLSTFLASSVICSNERTKFSFF